ncbi:hypothetical protein [Helicobacter sp. 11S02596-1]|uniref:hypothetical protein n=1 Tax=Helicobacter sp. 11S02596-1 TaxID=1476194 RepID=UPI000BA7A940|nr:hypothetical protein [Helicobacter sp. 11S02596-1]PAF41427.1 hypothetical protein BJI48_08695 [Helicobacter sp. 11S02596-1]
MEIGADGVDCCLSFSVFHYFPSLKYVKSVVLKMLKSSKKIVLLMDLLDVARKEEDLQAKAALGIKDLYTGALQHLYIPKEFLETLIDEYNRTNTQSVKFELWQQDIAGYQNSKYRYNAVFYKDC